MELAAATELHADYRLAIQAVATPFQKPLHDLHARRDPFEHTEDALVVALAALRRRDPRRSSRRETM